MNVLFTASLGFYFVATLLCFAGAAFKKDGVKNTGRIVLILAVAAHLIYIVWRGITARRLPLANQFEFATMFALMVAILGLVLDFRNKLHMDWILTLCAPMAFLLQSYAALQPKEITELMPALKSAWFGLHIGSAALSYSSFAVAALLGLRYLLLEKKAEEKHLKQLDNLSYKLICFGFLMLSIVIFSGCIWAEQAWSTFWSWDPKETWALITWIVYAVYLHQRFRMKWRGKRMAWFALLAFIFVMFTFVGVNTLMSGLHSYA
ncbi:MAG: c-type cytochrome biogenesis protein CcsB [Oscillospiraceae bacterium]|nr:c-type cytochrome biogenesis protein CcsB [Oscillospiraceae bacterium]